MYPRTATEGDVDDPLSEFRRPPEPTRCYVCIALTQIPESDAVKLRAAMAAKGTISPDAIVIWAKTRGYLVSRASVYNHRANHG